MLTYFPLPFQNIDFMPTILSRFDMIFIVKDEHEQGKDMVSCQSESLVQNHEKDRRLVELQNWSSRVKSFKDVLEGTECGIGLQIFY